MQQPENLISSRYNPAEVEQKWYDHWIKNNIFRSRPDHRTPYTIVIPPPNVTGVLHMGHMLNNTIQDILIRRARMKGFNALWLPGTDHASIATEAKVVTKLKSEGISKSDLTRDEFLKHAWEWKEKHGGIILEQLRKLGASCDWERTTFTMDHHMYESVTDVFVDLYRKGYIYRGVRMVNWDPKALTAVSDEEVNYREVESKLYYVRYEVLSDASHEPNASNQWITIATTRPETILGDTAVCVYPDDERFIHLIGKSVLIPIINRPVPVIADQYVDREFGTGALKVTPAHDINDYHIGIRHKLPAIDIFNPDGTLNEKAEIFIGSDRFVARRKMIEALQGKGHLVKEENYRNKVGFSERTDEVIEPKLSVQWFCRMNEMARPALELVMNDAIRFYPDKLKNTYKHWMENVKDWCISRQLWWGHRIPAWYLPDGQVFVAKTAEEAAKEASQKTGKTISPASLIQDEDVLDTWFSSWLWPIAVFDGIRNPHNPEIQYYYPTNDLVTAPDILFFWVARMIMAGWEYRKEIPFRNVYFTGMVRDKIGRKMSKSLGNSPDPVELLDTYGADGVRVGMMLMSPAGNDLLFDESLCEQGRNFSNKLWNALRLVKTWNSDQTIDQPNYSKLASEWFGSKLNQSIETIENHFDKYRISDALMTIYKLIWDDFCSVYLEVIKPAYGLPIDSVSLQQAINFFDTLMKLLHPFMPFITEEIWHSLNPKPQGSSVSVEAVPQAGQYDQLLIRDMDFISEIISGLRNARNTGNISQKKHITLVVRSSEQTPLPRFESLILKLGSLSDIRFSDAKPDGAISFMVRNCECYIPVDQRVDTEALQAKLQQELDYQQGFLNSVRKKLENEKFVANARPEVIEAERKKESDALSRIRAIEDQLSALRET